MRVVTDAQSSAGHRIAWSSPLLLGLGALAVAAFALLFVWERRVSDPMIPVRLLTQAVILRTNFVVMTFGASLFALVLYLPMFLQLGREAGVGESGMLLLPATLALALAAYFIDHFITRTGKLIMPIAGLSLSTLAFIALAATIHWAPTWLILTLIMLGAAGLGTVMPTSQILVQDEAGPRALGSATASVTVSRSFGGAIGAALAGALIFQIVGGDDPVFSHALAQLGEHGSQFLASLPADQRLALSTRIADAFRAVFVMVATITALGAVLAYSVPRRRI